MKIWVKDVDAFKQLILVKGYTQSALSYDIGITEVYGNQVYTGKIPVGPKTAKKIVDQLNVEFDDIFFVLNDRKRKQDNPETITA